MDRPLVPAAASPRDARPRCRVTAEDNARAERLRAFVRARSRECRDGRWRYDQRAERYWAEPFALLRRAAPDAPIDAVLGWYITDTPDAPVIRSGAEFRARWDWLQRLWAASPAGVMVSPAAAALAGRLAGRGWPRGAESQLPAAVQRSLDAAAAFLAGLGPSPSGFARVAAAELGSPGDAVERWYEAYLRGVRGWADWSGRVPVWAPTHPAVMAAGRGWAERYGVSSEEWNYLAAGGRMP